jgi:flagellar motor switch protein FliN/FliY
MNEAYRSNVMGVEIPVRVTIARKNVPLTEIIQLIPGAMILFNQQCDEPLTLDVENRTIGRGVAVKVGDKFGLKVSEIGKV